MIWGDASGYILLDRLHFCILSGICVVLSTSVCLCAWFLVSTALIPSVKPESGQVVHDPRVMLGSSERHVTEISH